ncbi:MAG: hypothetical protein ACO2ZM_08530 [Francisellaceae bacterium]
MINKSIRFYAFLSFITGVAFIVVAIITAGLFPELHLSPVITLIIEIIIAIPWVCFIICLFISLFKAD